MVHRLTNLRLVRLVADSEPGLGHVPVSGGRRGRAARSDGRDIDGALIDELAFVVSGGHGSGTVDRVDCTFHSVALPVHLKVQTGWSPIVAAFGQASRGPGWSP